MGLDEEIASGFAMTVSILFCLDTGLTHIFLLVSSKVRRP